MLRKVRIGLALLFFTAITLLFLDLTGFAGFWLYVKGHFTRERLR